jgi:hypothetical protein
MDAQPIPAVPAYSSRSRDAPGEGRAFTQSNWGESRGPREPRGGDSFGDRQASFGKRRSPGYSTSEHELTWTQSHDMRLVKL